MIQVILGYLNFYPNFLRQIPTGWWEMLAVLALWKTVLSWRIARQTGLHSYVWGGLAGALATMGFATAPLGQTLLQLVMFPAPMLISAFVVASISDARSWFSDEASDKYRLIRHRSLPLQIWGQVPADFHRTPGVGATRRQGVRISITTLLMMAFAYLSAYRASLSAGLGPRGMLLITIAVSMACFHALVMGIFAAVYGTRGEGKS